MRPSITAQDLERWQENGATWHAVSVTDGRAVIELRTCYGEAVDVLEGTDPELVAFVRAAGLPIQGAERER